MRRAWLICALCAACNPGIGFDTYDADRDGQLVLIGINAGETQCAGSTPVEVKTVVGDLRGQGIRVFAAANCIDLGTILPCCTCPAFRAIAVEVPEAQADHAIEFLGFNGGADLDCSTCYEGDSNDSLVEIECPFHDDSYVY